MSFNNYSSLISCSDLNKVSSIGSPVKAVVFPLVTITVSFELGNENSWLLHNDWIRDQKFMVETFFFKAESSHVDIVEAV